MAGVLKKIKKLRGRNLDELRVRGAQALAAYAERRGWSAQSREPSDAALFRMLDPARAGRELRDPEGLLEHFRTRRAPRFFASFDEKDETRRQLRGRFGGADCAELLRRADRLTEGRFDLLGLRDLDFGRPVDWHLEPLSGRRAPLAHWSLIDYLDARLTGDKKIIWELNRHQFFMTLGRAYWHTGDERYAQCFAAHLGSWMDANPPKLGVNWASSLEVSFRSISWLWALHFFGDSPALTPALLVRALKFLALGARHLETFLSTYFSPNTHLTGEALGLYYLGTLLPELRHAARWRAAGRSVLLAELDRHVRPDGTYFEQASYYHRYTADFYAHLLLLAQANGDAPPGAVAEKLAALLDHLMYITRPDGTTPLYGDDDGGRLAALDERAPDDFRAALATGAALLARPDYKYVGGRASEETLWLLGPEGLSGFDRLAARPPASQSRAFPAGGYYVMRDGWTPQSNYLLIDCGPHGTLNCGHAHADALAIDLVAGGRTLLVDPGTYTYTGDAGMRDWFRSSSAHNTLTVDGQSSSVPDGPFSWKHVAHASPRRWISSARFDYFEGEHDGYMRLSPPATHTRGVLFLKGDYWVVRDRVASDGAHRYDLHFHFAPGAAAAPAPGEDAAVAAPSVGADTPGASVYTFGAGGGWHQTDGWVSRCYGERTPAPVCTFSLEGEGRRELTTFILPDGIARHPAARAREVAAAGGFAFEIVGGRGHDLLLTGGGGPPVRAWEWESDFGWAWVRRAARGGDPVEVVLIGGGRLSRGGREVFGAGAGAGFLSARRAGDDLIVETDAAGEFRLATFGARRARVNGAWVEVDGAEVVRLGGGEVLVVEASREGLGTPA